MSFVAECTDCGWVFEDERRERVSEALERHGRKEQHQVEFSRRVIDAPV